MLGGCGEIGSLTYCWWGHKMVQHWETVSCPLKIIKQYDPTILPLGIYPKELSAGFRIDIYLHLEQHYS